MNVSIIAEEFLQQNWHFPLKKKAKNLSLNHPRNTSQHRFCVYFRTESIVLVYCLFLKTTDWSRGHQQAPGSRFKGRYLCFIINHKLIVRYRIGRAKTLLRCISSSSSTFPVESFEKNPPPLLWSSGLYIIFILSNVLVCFLEGLMHMRKKNPIYFNLYLIFIFYNKLQETGVFFFSFMSSLDPKFWESQC